VTRHVDTELVQQPVPGGPDEGFGDDAGLSVPFDQLAPSLVPR